MAARLAFTLNLDADLELGAGPGYQPASSVKAAMGPHVERLAASLLAPGDVLVDETCPEIVARGLTGRAFCPTPRALAVLRRAGAEPEPHPDVDVLRRVNSRAFSSSLGATMPGAAFVTDLESARAMLDGQPATGGAWRIKHAFGMAGRNQRVVVPSAADARDLAFVRAGLAQGGVQIEPDVGIVEEYALHGVISGDGSTRFGTLVRQRCDPRGAWLSTERIADATSLGDLPDRIHQEGRLVAAALRGAGYFGPFGIDAYSYRDEGGRLRLQPRSEINARYSMGFAVGFGRLSAVTGT
jgi:hypothetical protein